MNWTNVSNKFWMAEGWVHDSPFWYRIWKDGSFAVTVQGADHKPLPIGVASSLPEAQSIAEQNLKEQW